jgi:hypothetical protein
MDTKRFVFGVIGPALTFSLVASSVSSAQTSSSSQMLIKGNLSPDVRVHPKYAVLPETGSAFRDVIVSSLIRDTGACAKSSAQLIPLLGTRVSRVGSEIAVDNAFSIFQLDRTGTCSTMFSIELGSLPAGKYSLSAFPIGGPYSQSVQQEEPSLRTQKISFAILTADQATKASIEIPSQDSVQSGIGLISGWSCVAEAVEISIDGGTRIKVPSESPRGDVESACSHPNAGFGLLTNFNTLSEGEHTIQLYAKGVALGDVRRFKVVKPKGEFARGLSRAVTVTDFPEPGKTTTLDWREGEQRFGIREVK